MRPDHPTPIRQNIDRPITERKRTRNKKILVTGGAGFIGSHVADQLLARGDDVVIVDEINDYYDVAIKEGNLRLLEKKHGNNTNHDDDNSSRLSIYRGDICDVEFMEDVFAREGYFDAICHMAARAGVRPSIQNPFIYVHSNIEATVKLMDLAVQYNVPNFVMASSSSVYGGSRSAFFSEDEVVDRPISPYAATKKACELFAHAYHHQFHLNVTALRFFTVYGPRGRPDMAPFKFIDRVSRGASIQQFGDGSSSRDYTYVDDIVQGVVHSIDTPLPYEVFNLGKGSGTVLKEFLAFVEKYVGKKAQIERLPDQPGDVPYTCANISRAQALLGYNPTVSFEDGIQRTVEWYREVFRNNHEDDKAMDAAGNSVKESVRRLRELKSRALNDGQFQRSDTNSFFPFLEDFTDFGEESTSGDEDLFYGPEMIESETQSLRRKLLRQSKETYIKDELQKYPEKVKLHLDYKKVLVTGGASFLGSHVVKSLLERGDDVVLVDSATEEMRRLQSLNYFFSNSTRKGNLAVYVGKVHNATFMGHIFDRENPEWVCHLAETVRHEANSIGHIQANIEGTLRLLEFSKGSHRGGYDIKNFVMLSSHVVYGDRHVQHDKHQQIFRTEDERNDHPTSTYSASKKSAELFAYTYHHLYRIPISVLRMFHVYGPGQISNMSALKITDRVDRNSQWSDSSHRLDIFSSDYIYIDDAVRAILRSLDRSYSYEIFNVGGGNVDFCMSQSSGKLFDTADRLKKNGIMDNNKNVDIISCADMNKTKYFLDFKPEFSLRAIHQILLRHDENGSESQEYELQLLKQYEDQPSSIQNTFHLIHETSFQTWLRSLAFSQWLFIVAILSARAYFRLICIH
jgi:UDP-glucuronate 4-epimerase